MGQKLPGETLQGLELQPEQPAWLPGGSPRVEGLLTAYWEGSQTHPNSSLEVLCLKGKMKGVTSLKEKPLIFCFFFSFVFVIMDNDGYFYAVTSKMHLINTWTKPDLSGSCKTSVAQD